MWIKLPDDRYLNTNHIQQIFYDVSTVTASIVWNSMATIEELQGDNALALLTAIEACKPESRIEYLDMSFADPIAQQVMEMP
jgi:hypothetical protein